MRKHLQYCSGKVKIRSSMSIGICRKRTWTNGIIFGLLCCGMLLVEIHGTLGHTHSGCSYADNRVEYRTPSNAQINIFECDSSDPFCSLCYFYRLLGDSIISQADWFIDFRYVDQAVFVYYFSAGRTGRLQQESRSPPQV
jgi:hypothetical protein